MFFEKREDYFPDLNMKFVNVETEFQEIKKIL